MSGIAVLTDSTSDIPPDLVQRYNIYVAPYHIQFGFKIVVFPINLARVSAG